MSTADRDLKDFFFCRLCCRKEVELYVLPCGHGVCESCASQVTTECPFVICGEFATLHERNNPSSNYKMKNKFPLMIDYNIVQSAILKRKPLQASTIVTSTMEAVTEGSARGHSESRKTAGEDPSLSSSSSSSSSTSTASKKSMDVKKELSVIDLENSRSNSSSSSSSSSDRNSGTTTTATSVGSGSSSSSEVVAYVESSSLERWWARYYELISTPNLNDVKPSDDLYIWACAYLNFYRFRTASATINGSSSGSSGSRSKKQRLFSPSHSLLQKKFDEFYSEKFNEALNQWIDFIATASSGSIVGGVGEEGAELNTNTNVTNNSTAHILCKWTLEDNNVFQKYFKGEEKNTTRNTGNSNSNSNSSSSSKKKKKSVSISVQEESKVNSGTIKKVVAESSVEEKQEKKGMKKKMKNNMEKSSSSNNNKRKRKQAEDGEGSGSSSSSSGEEEEERRGGNDDADNDDECNSGRYEDEEDKAAYYGFYSDNNQDKDKKRPLTLTQNRGVPNKPTTTSAIPAAAAASAAGSLSVLANNSSDSNSNNYDRGKDWKIQAAHSYLLQNRAALLREARARLLAEEVVAQPAASTAVTGTTTTTTATTAAAIATDSTATAVTSATSSNGSSSSVLLPLVGSYYPFCVLVYSSADNSSARSAVSLTSSVLSGEEGGFSFLLESKESGIQQQQQQQQQQLKVAVVICRVASISPPLDITSESNNNIFTREVRVDRILNIDHEVLGTSVKSYNINLLYNSGKNLPLYAKRNYSATIPLEDCFYAEGPLTLNVVTIKVPVGDVERRRAAGGGGGGCGDERSITTSSVDGNININTGMTTDSAARGESTTATRTTTTTTSISNITSDIRTKKVYNLSAGSVSTVRRAGIYFTQFDDK